MDPDTRGLTSYDSGENKPSDSFGFAVDKDKYYHGSLRCCLACFPREIILRDSLNHHLLVILSIGIDHDDFTTYDQPLLIA